MSPVAPKTTLLAAPPHLEPVDTPLALPVDVEKALIYLRTRVQAEPQDPRLQFLRERAGLRFFDTNTQPWIVDPLTAPVALRKLLAGEVTPVPVRRLPYAVMAALHPGVNPLLAEAFDLMLATAPVRLRVSSILDLRERFAEAAGGYHVLPIGITGVVYARDPAPVLVCSRRSRAVAVNAKVWTTPVDGGLLSLEGWPQAALTREAHSESSWVASLGNWEYIGLVVPGSDAAPSGINALFGLSVARADLLEIRAAAHFESDSLRLVDGGAWEEPADATSASLAASLEHLGFSHARASSTDRRHDPLIAELRALRVDAREDATEGPRHFATHYFQALLANYPSVDDAVRELQDESGESGRVSPLLRRLVTALQADGVSHDGRVYEAVVHVLATEVYRGRPPEIEAGADYETRVLMTCTALRAGHRELSDPGVADDARVLMFEAAAQVPTPAGYALCRRALAAFPSQPSLHHLAALYKAASNELDGALESAQRAIDLDPDWPVYLATRAEIKRRSGAAAEARHDYQAAIALAERLQEEDWQDLSAWIERWTIELNDTDD